MEIGVSTACFYPMQTEEALALLANGGVACCEIFLNSLGELRQAFIAELANIKNAGGTKVIAVHSGVSFAEPTLFFSDYERRYEEGLELYRRYFAVTAELGAHYFIFHGDREIGRVSEEIGFERFARLADEASAAGVTLLQENVNAHKSAHPDYIKRMRRALGEKARFCLDLKQAVRAGFDPYVIMDAMGEALRHIHISDHTQSASCLLPGRGNFDFATFFARCDAAGYQGAGMIEVYADAYRKADEVIKTYQILCG